MDTYQTTVTRRKDYIGSTERTIQFYKKSKKPISFNDIRNISNGILTKAPSGTKLRIRGLGIDRWHTLKAMDGDLDILNEEEYYAGRVKNTGNFTNFSQLEITILKEK
jgi:hypothetical protein